MIARVLLILLGLLSVALIAIYLVSDSKLLEVDPRPGVLNTDERVLVHDSRCEAGEVKELIGATPTTERDWTCVPYDQARLIATRLVWLVEDTFGKLYVVLTVLGTLAAGIAVVHWYVSTLFSRQKPKSK